VATEVEGYTEFLLKGLTKSFTKAEYHREIKKTTVLKLFYYSDFIMF